MQIEFMSSDTGISGFDAGNFLFNSNVSGSYSVSQVGDSLFLDFVGNLLAPEPSTLALWTILLALLIGRYLWQRRRAQAYVRG